MKTKTSLKGGFQWGVGRCQNHSQKPGAGMRVQTALKAGPTAVE